MNSCFSLVCYQSKRLPLPFFFEENAWDAVCPSKNHNCNAAVLCTVARTLPMRREFYCSATHNPNHYRPQQTLMREERVKHERRVELSSSGPVGVWGDPERSEVTGHYLHLVQFLQSIETLNRSSVSQHIPSLSFSITRFTSEWQTGTGNHLIPSFHSFLFFLFLPPRLSLFLTPGASAK